MIKAKLANRVQELVEGRVPFVLATVVRARRPTSVRPGDTAIVIADGTIDGFVGGLCAEASVRLYALRALETGEPVLLRLVPGEGDGLGEPDDGAIIERNPCLSGGALEIFLEPQLPAARLVVVGGSPIAAALVEVARAAGYAVHASPAVSAADLDGAQALVVAAHGAEEEAALATALAAGVPYVALVASRRRGEAVRAGLDVPAELAAQLHTPAGLDIGARTPPEIAVSILAQLIECQHADPAPGRPPVSVAAPSATAIDPICGMTVAIAGATVRLEAAGETVYFCGPGCRDAFAHGHAGQAAGGRDGGG